MKHTIFGIHISHRTENVPALQATLTKYGSHIWTRLGIHDADATSCSPSGLGPRTSSVPRPRSSTANCRV